MFALVNLDTLSVKEFAQTADLDAQTKPPFKWMAITHEERPAVTSGQVVIGPSYVVAADSVTEGYSVRDKTPDEVAADVDMKIARINEETRTVLSNFETRLTELEGKPVGGGIMSFLRGLFR